MEDGKVWGMIQMGIELGATKDDIVSKLVKRCSLTKEVASKCYHRCALALLMEDFRCTKADDMHFPILAERMGYLKEGEGREELCRAVEEDLRKRAEEDRENALQKTKKRLLKKIAEEKLLILILNQIAKLKTPLTDEQKPQPHLLFCFHAVLA